MPLPNKSLGQHWLHDRAVLSHIAACADIKTTDTVLEIGPGLGTLTSELLRRSQKVIAVEFDPDLARKLPAQFPGKNLEVVQADILAFDTARLPSPYKVVGNIPYYITSKIIQHFLVSPHQPEAMVLLIQKEVACRLAAGPGDMSILAVSAQVFSEVRLGQVVPARLFTPPPRVDSQVVVLRTRTAPLVGENIEKHFFTVVKAGFSAKRKMLRSSLAGGLGVTKDQAAAWLEAAKISPTARAESLSISDWMRLEETTR